VQEPTFPLISHPLPPHAKLKSIVIPHHVTEPLHGPLPEPPLSSGMTNAPGQFTQSSITSANKNLGNGLAQHSVMPEPHFPSHQLHSAATDQIVPVVSVKVQNGFGSGQALVPVNSMRANGVVGVTPSGGVNVRAQHSLVTTRSMSVMITEPSVVSRIRTLPLSAPVPVYAAVNFGATALGIDVVAGRPSDVVIVTQALVIQFQASKVSVAFSSRVKPTHLNDFATR